MISEGKIRQNTPPQSGIEPGPRRGQTVSYIRSPTELSRPGPWRGQTVRYISSPTELLRLTLDNSLKGKTFFF